MSRADENHRSIAFLPSIVPANFPYESDRRDSDCCIVGQRRAAEHAVLIVRPRI